MPLYEYACKKCDHRFETLVLNGEEVECPECRSADLEKLLSVPGEPKIGAPLPSGGCSDPSLPPCGAPGCRRTGRG